MQRLCDCKGLGSIPCTGNCPQAYPANMSQSQFCKITLLYFTAPTFNSNPMRAAILPRSQWLETGLLCSDYALNIGADIQFICKNLANST